MPSLTFITHSSIVGTVVAALCAGAARWYRGSMLAFLDGPELIVVVVVLLVLFGGTQLPKLARGLGQAQKEFKKGLSDERRADGDTGRREARLRRDSRVLAREPGGHTRRR